MPLTAALPAENPLVSLSSEQSEALKQAISGLNTEQLIWSSGYLAGLAVAHTAPSVPPETAAEQGEQLTILYGSQTGNGQKIAEQLFKAAQRNGVAAKLVNMLDYKARNITKESWVAFVVSTHGEGDAPDDAEILLEYLNSKRAPTLNQLSYFILALGDSSYVQYCQTGHDFDDALSALGATRLSELAECDVDYEERSVQWASQTLSVAREKLLPAGVANRSTTVPLQVVNTEPNYDKDSPFNAEVLLKQQITGRNSSKKVHHLEFDLTASGIVYEPGDALGIVTSNPSVLVQELLQSTGFGEEALVRIGDQQMSLGEALESRLEITANSGAFIQRYIDLTGAEDLADIFAQPEKKRSLLYEYQVIDVLREWPLPNADSIDAAQNFVETLRPLTPRVYSISSSPLATPEEAHVTVAHVAYTAFGRPHWGSASTALTDSFAEGDVLGVYVESNPRFRLPLDGSSDVIMIGPGTGVAPFRSFVEHRAAQEADGRNWLFFGDRNFSDDFLYQTEWQKHLKDKTLHRLDVAFSRDQESKVYVQDCLKRNSKDVFAWLEGGAYLYVCGDATHMAPDVHAALLEIIAQESDTDLEAAENYLKNLKQQHRYLRDVY